MNLGDGENKIKIKWFVLGYTGSKEQSQDSTPS